MIKNLDVEHNFTTAVQAIFSIGPSKIQINNQLVGIYIYIYYFLWKFLIAVIIKAKCGEIPSVYYYFSCRSV